MKCFDCSEWKMYLPFDSLWVLSYEDSLTIFTECEYGGGGVEEDACCAALTFHTNQQYVQLNQTDPEEIERQ